ncbi:MAG TPA: RNHCP domain-containing protein [Anaerolineales bacterium]|nr:RNHCP domain-containing protein [Anaerolineales bacterium]HLE73909.1 RNHCP domain-containing protein [Anaerolineales bacterium]
MLRRFQRRVEDFVCLNCGFAVQGGGYTNHCPRCLFSLHVDINPGDRQAACGGLMAPVAVSTKSDSYRVLHRCRDCGFEKWNQAARQDDFEQLLSIARTQGGGFRG